MDFGFASNFVNISMMLSLVGMYVMSIFSSFTASQMKWYCRLICFVLEWNLLSLTSTNAPWLSPEMVNDLTLMPVTLLTKVCNQIASFVAWVSVIYLLWFFLLSTSCSHYLFYHCILILVLSLLLVLTPVYDMCPIPYYSVAQHAQHIPFSFATCFTYIYHFLLVYKLTRVHCNTLVYSLYSNIQLTLHPLKYSGLGFDNLIV